MDSETQETKLIKGCLLNAVSVASLPSKITDSDYSFTDFLDFFARLMEGREASSPTTPRQSVPRVAEETKAVQTTTECFAVFLALLPIF